MIQLGQKTKDRRQKTEDKRQKTNDKRQKTGDIPYRPANSDI